MILTVSVFTAVMILKIQLLKMNGASEKVFISLTKKAVNMNMIGRDAKTLV